MSSDSPAPIRVVLIDDADEERLLLRTMLERRGEFAVVGEGADGEAGVRAVFTHRPALVLLDVSMPVLDGFEALLLIREGCPEVVVVMLSAFTPRDTAAAKAKALGAHGYFVKGGGIRRLREDLLAIVRDNAARGARSPTVSSSPATAPSEQVSGV